MKRTYTDLLDENELLRRENANLKVELLMFEDLKQRFNDLKNLYKEIGKENQRLLNKIAKLKEKR